MTEIEISHPHGSIFGYLCPVSAEQLAIYLQREGHDPALEIAISQSGATCLAILKSLHVEDAHRREGIGSDLLNQFVERASDAGAEITLLTADTAERNPFSLVSWYEDRGFTRLTQKTDFPLLACGDEDAIGKIRAILQIPELQDA